MDITQKQTDDVVHRDDPRLLLPGISLYAQDVLGCSFLLVSLLPCIAVLFNSITEGDTAKSVQYAVIILTVLWVSMWISNYRFVSKMRHSGSSGTATVIDRFIDDGGETRSYVLVYEFEHSNSDGQKQIIQARYYCYTYAEFDVPIGNTLKFYSVPINYTMAKLTRQLPFMWAVTSPDVFEARISKWMAVTAMILTITSSAMLWIRAALQAAELNWAAIFTTNGIARLYKSITSPNTMQQLWQTSQQVPIIALVSIIGLIVMVIALNQWWRSHDKTRYL